MSGLVATIEGLGFWAPGLPSWAAARAFVADGTLAVDAPMRPVPRLLPANERRRAPEGVAVALEVALAACESAGADPAQLSSVFTSTHGDMGITDYICSTLASDPSTLSPTKFHNSVHNAAAGYWTIAAGCHAPATAVSSRDASFAQGLVEAMVQLAAGADRVLLVAYDAASPGPVGAVSRSEGLLGAALVLARRPRHGLPRLRATLVDAATAPAAAAGDSLSRRLGANAMAPMLPLFQALAGGGDLVSLHAGPSRALRMEIANG
ncbi:MAG: beta-ketoacyl synthase chain length factor [Pseudomonadota bacterium]|nr:beta-ketoacyl synthase chain length factor [Pseudomonadota bacterium]